MDIAGLFLFSICKIPVYGGFQRSKKGVITVIEAYFRHILRGRLLEYSGKCRLFQLQIGYPCVIFVPNDESYPHHMTNPSQDQRIAKMTFSSVYPLYLAKVEKKGRTKAELDQVIQWLTGFDNNHLQQLIDEKTTFETFFQRATLNPNAHLITGVICGYRVEDIEDPLTQKVRYLDKLVDELAKGKKMEKILRGS